MNPHACEYLRRIEPCQWSRSHFSEWPKSDNITNNNAEVFNGCIKKMRGKPIITMLEEIRCYIMRILARNKKALVGYMGRITPVQQSRLEVEKRYSNHWRPFPTGDLAGNIFEVQCLPIKVSVDLGKKTCSCRFWQLNGLPCRHACAALAYQNRRPEEYANNWLTIGAYNKTYEFLVQAVPSKEFWEKHGYANILPPAYKRPSGRPTVKRNKRNDAPEPQPDPHRVKRKYGQIVCQYCLIAGHNSRTCQKKKDDMAAPKEAGPAAVPDAAPTAVLDAAPAAPAAPVTAPSMVIPNPDPLIPP